MILISLVVCIGAAAILVALGGVNVIALYAGTGENNFSNHFKDFKKLSLHQYFRYLGIFCIVAIWILLLVDCTGKSGKRDFLEAIVKNLYLERRHHWKASSSVFNWLWRWKHGLPLCFRIRVHIGLGSKQYPSSHIDCEHHPMWHLCNNVDAKQEKSSTRNPTWKQIIEFF